MNYLLRLSKNAPKLFEKADIEQKRSLIDMVLSNLELDGELLRYKLKEPFKTVRYCQQLSSWLTTIEGVITAIKLEFAY